MSAVEQQIRVERALAEVEGMQPFPAKRQEMERTKVLRGLGRLQNYLASEQALMIKPRNVGPSWSVTAPAKKRKGGEQ